jgi:phospholipid/cholesterol/gamma-HCH transport system ATP-binding protein
MTERRHILHIKDASVETDDYGGIDAIAIDLDVVGGELLLLLVEHLVQGAAFADVCAGLRVPLTGVVQFLGREWRHLTADAANAQRGRIGRVLREGAWVRQLSLKDNILLQQLHHTRDSLHDLLDQASRLAQQFGLPGVPLGHFEAYSDADLQRAACVRAFLGQPALVLLEEPTRHLNRGNRFQLINVIQETRDKGAAVIWITRDRTVWQDATIPATRRYRWIGRKLMEVHVK